MEKSNLVRPEFEIVYNLNFANFAISTSRTNFRKAEKFQKKLLIIWYGNVDPMISTAKK